MAKTADGVMIECLGGLGGVDNHLRPADSGPGGIHMLNGVYECWTARRASYKPACPATIGRAYCWVISML